MNRLWNSVCRRGAGSALWGPAGRHSRGPPAATLVQEERRQELPLSTPPDGDAHVQNRAVSAKPHAGLAAFIMAFYWQEASSLRRKR
jgi:hypothetical protein